MPVYISFSAPVEKKKKKKRYGLTHGIQFIITVSLHIQFLWALIKQYPSLFLFFMSDDAVLQPWHWSMLQSYPFVWFSPFFFFFIASSALVCRLLPIPCQHTYLCWSMCTSDIIFTFKYLIMCFFLIICNQQESWLAPKDNLDISSKLQNEFQNQCCVHWISI